MLPEINLLGLSIDSYGLMLTVALAAVIIVLERMAVERGLPRRWVPEGAAVAIVAGVAGARGYAIVQDANAGDLSLGEAIGTGGGLVWYGGFLAGAAAVWVWARWRRVPLLVAADGAGVGLPLGYVMGRIGCQLSGDGDYGTESDLPWAMGYPDGTVPTAAGVEVHPTPVYEALVMLAVFAVLWRYRHRFRDGVLFALYLLAAGTERFLVEFVRRNDDVLAGLTAAQLQSLVAVALGGALLAVLKSGGAPLSRRRTDVLTTADVPISRVP